MKAVATAAGVAWLLPALAAAQPAPAVRSQACDRAAAAYKESDWKGATAAAEQCEQAARAASDDALLARALLLRGHIAYGREARLDSLPLYQAAAAAASRAGDGRLLSEALYRVSAAYAALEDWAAFLDYARRSFEANPAPDAMAHLRLLEAQAWTAMELHERDALEKYDEALALARSMGDPKAVAWIASEAGLATWRLAHDRDQALALYDEALRLARQSGDIARQYTVLNNSGNLFRYPGTYDEAERRYREGLALAARQGARHAYLMKNLGIVLRETGRREQAERLLLEAVETADRNGIARIRWQARMELGTLYRFTDAARAARYFEECLDFLEAHHSNVLLEDFSSGALAGSITIYDDPYDLYIDHLMRQGDTARALLVAERARARAFLDTLSAARAEISARIPRAYIDEERALLRSISEGQARLRSATLVAGDRQQVEAAVARDEDALAVLRVRLAAEHPDIAHARYPRLLSASQIERELLADGDVLLEYFVGAESTTLWIVRRGRLTALRLPGRAEIDALVREHLAAVSTPAGQYEAPARAAARVLLPAMVREALQGARRLVIVPHGILNYLPFETLLGDESRFLIEDYAVSYAPSAASLAFLRARPAHEAGGVIAVGNPVVSARGAAAERTLPMSQLAFLKPLQNAGRELQSVARAFPGARVLEGPRATEPELARAGLDRAAILHFATHGLMDEELPQRSGLALTAAPPESDGLLQMREIYSLPLHASLVTLSACQTALGKDVTGEGLIGLTRAFFHAGADAVVASLWNVDDASTADFMRRFYTSLGAGSPIDAAARQARLAFLRGDARLRHPYFWGAFVASGNASVPVRVASRPRPILPLTAAFAALLTVVAALAWRRRGPNGRSLAPAVR